MLNILDTVQSVRGVSGKMYNALNKEEIKAYTKVVPSYLDEHFSDSLQSTTLDREVRKEVSMLWRMDGRKLTGEENARSISFTNWLPGVKTVKARTVKNFSYDYVRLLADSWGINAPLQLVNDEDVQVRFYQNQGNANSYLIGANSVSGFLASTANNAPYYLLFVLRVSIAIVLIWAIFFGGAYFIGTRKIIIIEEKK